MKILFPRAPNGDTVIKTYHDSVFNEEKYKNRTTEQVMEINANFSDEDVSRKETITTIKCTCYGTAAVTDPAK